MTIMTSPSVAGFEKFRFQNVLRPSGGSRGGAHPKLMKVRPEGHTYLRVWMTAEPPHPPPSPISGSTAASILIRLADVFSSTLETLSVFDGEFIWIRAD